jgi:hypothetical protein
LHSAEPDYVATAVESEYFVEELVQIVRYGMSLGHTESGKFVDEVLKVSNLLNNGCGVFLHKHLLSYPGEGLQLKTVICIYESIQEMDVNIRRLEYVALGPS